MHKTKISLNQTIKIFQYTLLNIWINCIEYWIGFFGSKIFYFSIQRRRKWKWKKRFSIENVINVRKIVWKYCSKVYASILTCPKQYAWNSPRVTQKWANQNHNLIRQQLHIPHWCTHLLLDVIKIYLYILSRTCTCTLFSHFIIIICILVFPSKSPREVVDDELF